MMNKLFKYNNQLSKLVILLLSLVIVGCTDNEVEPVFDKSINERVDELKNEYLNVLTAPENGWIGYYTPNEDFGVYTMLLNFDNDGSVQITSDYNRGASDKNITYRLDKTLKIELVLESFAVFHEIFEINNNNNKGEFVFNVLSATNEEVVLESKLDFGDDITIFTLKKATTEDLDLSKLYEVEDDLIGTPQDSGLRNILLGENEIGTFSYNASDRTATITYVSENNEEVVEVVRIVITPDGFFFFDPISIGNVPLTNFIENTTNGYVNSDNADLVIDDFLICPFDPNDFVGTYSANEEGYCNGCYVVEVTYNETFNVFILSNLYDFGGAAVVELNAVPSATDPSVNFVGATFDIPIQVSGTFGNVWAVNPGDISGDPADNLSTFSPCNQYMDLYFSRCVSVGCFSGVTRVQLTKL